MVSLVNVLNKNSNKKFSTKLVIIFLVLISVSILISLSPAIQANEKWRLSKEEEGIKIYVQDKPRSKLKSFKGHMTINSRLSALVSVLEDTETYPRWLHNCRSAKTLRRKSDTQFMNYVVTNMPWPVADRDAVIESVRTQNNKTKQVEIVLNAEPQAASKVKGKVRIHTLSGRWLLTPKEDRKIDIMYEMTVDPSGNIPKWIVNAMAVDLPFYTLQKLRNVVKEEQYQQIKLNSITE